ncbi:hypothetical protein ACFZAV_07415 [Streptomyces sp. NPDC008343]|uniref:hypothetical protein n=1 Tax=Streptomyces sp. NPDC008343 TaxID=3364828 RepID=UPI0036E2C3B9
MGRRQHLIVTVEVRALPADLAVVGVEQGGLLPSLAVGDDDPSVTAMELPWSLVGSVASSLSPVTVVQITLPDLGSRGRIV